MRVDPNVHCGVTEMNTAIERLGGNTAPDDVTFAPACAEIAIAADYSMVTEFGSVSNVETEVIAVLNMVTAKYEENPMQISYDLVETYVVSCNGCDPWSSSTNASTLLSSFNGWNGFSKTYDVASLWTKRDIEESGNNGVIGLAYIGQICQSNNHNLLEHYYQSQTGSMVDQAHELGHNWNCQHISPANTTNIMSPSIGPSNTTRCGPHNPRTPSPRIATAAIA
ncbi:MAG: hypothetical protein H6585_08270 [Flavobacteriales bacterium]|nr:hypothetical protein [Flavobacteriales bacterium]